MFLYRNMKNTCERNNRRFVRISRFFNIKLGRLLSNFNVKDRSHQSKQSHQLTLLVNFHGTDCICANVVGGQQAGVLMHFLYHWSVQLKVSTHPSNIYSRHSCRDTLWGVGGVCCHWTWWNWIKSHVKYILNIFWNWIKSHVEYILSISVSSPLLAYIKFYTILGGLK